MASIGGEVFWLSPEISRNLTEIISGNPATQVGSPSLVQHEGRTTLELTNNSYLEFTLASNVVFPFSMSAWIMPYQTRNAAFFHLGENRTVQIQQQIGAFASDSLYTFSRGFGSTQQYLYDPAVLTYSVWRHVAVSLTSATSRTMYVNGVSVASTNVSAPTNNKNFVSIGAYSNGFFDMIGMVGDLRIFNRAITAADVVQLASVRGVSPVTSRRRKHSQQSQQGALLL